MDQATANYAVKYHNAARTEAKRLLVKPEQYLFCVEQAKLLRFFPITSGGQAGRFFSLDVKRIEDYWELRVWDKILEHRCSLSPERYGCFPFTRRRSRKLLSW